MPQIPSTLRALLAAEIDPAFAARATLIVELLIEKRPRRVLDVGCGRGFYLHILSELDFIEEIRGVDVNREYLRRAGEACRDPRITVQEAVIERLPFPDDSFDFVICSEVLEHLSDDEAGLREIHRVLRPGGTLVVSVPNRHFPFLWDPLNWLLMTALHTHVPKHIWWLAGIWADHERLYTREDLDRAARRTGFAVGRQETVVAHCLPFSHFLLYGIGKNVVERLGVKEFDRFNYRRGSLSGLLARVFRWPTVLDRGRANSRSVDIVAEFTRA